MGEIEINLHGLALYHGALGRAPMQSAVEQSRPGTDERGQLRTGRGPRGSKVSQYVAFGSILILKHVSKLPLRKQNFSLKNRPSEKGQRRDGWQMVCMFPAALMDRLGGEMPAWACLQRQREGGGFESRGLGRGRYGPEAHVLVPRASPSPLAETDGEALWCPSLRPFFAPCLAWAPCFPTVALLLPLRPSSMQVFQLTLPQTVV